MKIISVRLHLTVVGNGTLSRKRTQSKLTNNKVLHKIRWSISIDTTYNNIKNDKTYEICL